MGRVERLQAGGEDLLVEDAPDGAAKAVEHEPLAGERLHDPDPGDALLDFTRQLGESLLDLLDRRSRAPVVPHGRQHHERHRQQREGREVGLEREHHRAREHERQRVLRQEDQPVAQEEANRLQVDRRPRHQLPGLLGVEETELEPLQVPVEALPKVELDRHRDLPRDQAAHHGQADAEDPCADDRQHQGQDRGAIRSGRVTTSTASPTSHGIATVITIASQAKTSEAITERR